MKRIEDTGRIKSLLFPEIRELVFGRVDRATIEQELMHYAQIDQVHLCGLHRQGVAPRDKVRTLIETIRRWASERFLHFEGLEPVRGVYLLYENELISAHGLDVGGILQTGRSRNDLNATVMRLRLRGAYTAIMGGGLCLLDELINRATDSRDLPLPAYTHNQTAFPTTVGHYLAAIAARLGRDMAYLEEAFDAIDSCPLGACAGGGTSIPIDAEWSARCLGFREAVKNSIDAVASRDLVLRVLSSAAVVSVTLTRFAADLGMWSTNEFRLVTFPDELVGSSSNMPQKRNPFLLEHLKGMSAAVVSASNAALICSLGTPFGNSVSVAGEATRHVWTGCSSLQNMLTISGYIVKHAQFDPERGKELIESGYAAAVFLAERAVIDDGVAFRIAHEQIGTQVSEAMKRGAPLEEPATAFKIEDAIRGMKYGAGSGTSTTGNTTFLESAQSVRKLLESKRSARQSRWHDVDDKLDKIVRDLYEH